MKTWFIWLTMTTALLADDGDDTLRGWMAKADLVVAGTIANEPIGITHETGVPNYLCDFKVADVLQGDATLAGQTLAVNIVRFELVAKDKSPLVKKDAQCILFLKNVSPDKPVWQTADFWFGLQPASPWLALALKRLDAETTPFEIRCQRAEDTIVAGKEDFGQVLTVTSPGGIGRATITLRANTWPNPLKFRFKLKGLEGLTVDTGKGKPHELSHRDANVKQVDGGFEVVIPRDWLGEDVKSLAVQWIDFYR
jgi:hypothetical protein